MDKNKLRVRKFLALFLALSLVLTGCSFNNVITDKVTSGEVSSDGQNTQQKKGGDLEIHFIDVGQGSSALIESNSHFMLVDGGDSKYSSRVVSYLEDQDVDKLDYVIATHYDADHLNGVVGALNSYDAEVVIAPDYKAKSKVYQSFIDVLDSKNIDITYPKTGTKYKIGNAEFTILAPNDIHYSDANDYSVAIKLVNGSNTFIMTGDAEIESEYEMLETGIDLSCDVYMAGHHGSKSSSSQAFMQAMQPASVVISVGKNNKYRHPSDEAMARFNAMGCDIYRTDELGDIIAVSDGKTIKFNTKASKKGTGKKKGSTSSKSGNNYIGNVNSKKFHKKACSSLPDEENMVYFGTINEAEDAGYEPCGICNPE